MPNSNKFMAAFSKILLLRRRRGVKLQQRLLRKQIPQIHTPSTIPSSNKLLTARLRMLLLRRRHGAKLQQQENYADKYTQYDTEFEQVPDSLFENAATKATTRREAAEAVAQKADSMAAEARRQFNKLKGEYGNMAKKCLGASQTNAAQTTKEANKLKSKFDNMATCLDASYENSKKARAPHTNGPKDVPRCGALSLLQKPLH